MLIEKLILDNRFFIRKIPVNEALPIRHSVLWPNKSMEECRVEDDETGEHFGVFIDGELVCVASVFVREKTARLRKFATIEKYRGQGIGYFVLKHIINLLQQQSIVVFWCDARESAKSLYERIGMKSDGERFFKGDVAYRKMRVHLSNARFDKTLK